MARWTRGVDEQPLCSDKGKATNYTCPVFLGSIQNTVSDGTTVEGTSQGTLLRLLRPSSLFIQPTRFSVEKAMVSTGLHGT